MLTLAVIGTGPRGISVLERLAVRLEAGGAGPVTIHAIDAHEVGAGRVWRTDQSGWYTMNTVVGQVTMYSGGRDGGPARPGAGPSLGEWLAAHARPGEPAPGPDDYAPRAVYGRYLRSVHRSIARNLPPRTELTSVTARVTALTPAPGGGYRLTLDRPPHTLYADRVLLATGHPRNEPDDAERALRDFSRRHPGARWLSGDSAAELESELLDETRVAPGTRVGIRGLGLSFYDVLLTLTVGRGGRFVRDPDGALRYLPSGREPRIVAGSRGGLPIPARGRNEKSPTHRHRALFLTPAALSAARARRAAATGDDRLDFAEDVLPPLLSELEQIYRTAQVRARSGRRRAARFARRHAAALREGRDTTALLAREGLGRVPGLDLAALARPFAGEDFASPGAFRDRLLRVMEEDLAEAALGNVNGPLKAALDALRDLRSTVREAVDHGGLLPESHRDAFKGRFLPLNSLLSAGPPAERSEQLMALIRQGFVEIAGPEAVFAPDPASGRFLVSSPRVRGSARTVSVLVDARIPPPDLRRDSAPVVRRLLSDGLAREFTAVGPDGQPYPTGGLDVTPECGQVVDARGEPSPGLYALGIPTEHTRWFTQVGSGRPGEGTRFHQDADAVAAAMLRGADPRPAPRHAPAARHTEEAVV
ncbi:FAD/NAD(P)-binding protein [Streptomyces sp. NPDC055078]